MQEEHCPICGGKATIVKLGPLETNISVICIACGTYYALNGHLDIPHDKFASFLFYYKLENSIKNGFCCFIRNRALYLEKKTKHPNIKLLDNDEVEKWYPDSFEKKIDMILQTIGKITKFEGQCIHLNYDEKLSMFFINRMLMDGVESSTEDRQYQYQYYIDYMQKNDYLICYGDDFLLQPSGYKRIKQHEQIKQQSEAMKEMVPNTIRSKVEEFIKRGEEIGKTEYQEGRGRIGFIPHVAGPLFDVWVSEINIFNERYLKKHPLYSSIHSVYFHRKNVKTTYDEMIGLLRALASDSEFWDSYYIEPIPTSNDGMKKEGREVMVINEKIFIVHGRDEEAKITMARTLEKAGFEAIILHERANGGKTIIEKIEANADVSFAVVLYTPCDVGRPKDAKAENEKSRARQNVVFEHGYLIGKLGRERVCALVKGDIEKPGDIDGVIYIDMDINGSWKMKLAQEMKNVGIPIDMNKFW